MFTTSIVGTNSEYINQFLLFLLYYIVLYYKGTTIGELSYHQWVLLHILVFIMVIHIKLTIDRIFSNILLDNESGDFDYMKHKVFAPVLLAVFAVLIAQPGSTQTAKTAAKPAFDQQAVLKKVWKSSGKTVVGTVGSVKVTKDELIETLWYFDAPNALNYVLNQKLIEEGAKKEGVSVTKAEIDAKALETAQSNNFRSFDEMIIARKWPKIMVMNDLRMNLLAEKVARKTVKVTDADLGQYVLVRHVLAMFPKDEPDEAKKKEIALKRVQDVAAKVKAGEDFAKLAKEFSDDGSKANGGLLEWSTKGAWVKEFEDAVYALKPGQVSEPVASMFGYHLIKLEKTGKEATPAEKKKLTAEILTKKIQTPIREWVAKLNKSTKINNTLIDNSPPAPPVRKTVPNRGAPNNVPELPPAPPTP
jgi:foldase protein PrsA